MHVYADSQGGSIRNYAGNLGDWDMVDRLPRPEEVGGAVWPHNWFPYEGYKTVHERYINDAINEGIIIENRLAFNEVRQGRRLIEVNIKGRIECEYGLTIFVDKWLKVDDTQRVRGSDYNYHAMLTNPLQDVIRYDNSHGPNELHCHLFNLENGTETIHPIQIEDLPTLDRFIRIAFQLVKDAQGR